MKTNRFKSASILLLGISILCSISSCKRNPSNSGHGTGLTVIRFNELEEKELFYPDDSIERCFFLPLETTDSCLIGWVERIRFADSLIFVHDGKMNALLVFNRAGKFLNQIGTIGQGADDLISLVDFYINEDEKFVGILDIMKRKMYRYAYDGRLIGKFDFAPEINYISKIRDNYDGKLFISRKNNLDNRSNYYVVNEKDYSLEKQALPYIVQGEKTESDSFFGKTVVLNKRLYALALLSDTIYGYLNGDLSPAIILDHSFKKITKEFIAKHEPYEFSSSARKYLQEENFSLGISTIFSVKDYLYFKFNDYAQGKNCGIFWNPVEQKGFYISKNPFSPYPFSSPVGLNNGVVSIYQDAFVSLVEAFCAKEILTYRKLFKNPDDVKVLENVDEEDNPILIFYHMNE